MKRKLLISACLMGIGCRYDGKSIKKVDVERISEKYDLIPVCPEIYGGLPTPRPRSERIGNQVFFKDGTEVTENFERGAEHVIAIAKATGARRALLKQRSPSCGKGEIFDGSFTGRVTVGLGVAAEFMMMRGIHVYTEHEIDMLLKDADAIEE